MKERRVLLYVERSGTFFVRVGGERECGGDEGKDDNVCGSIWRGEEVSGWERRSSARMMPTENISINASNERPNSTFD